MLKSLSVKDFALVEKMNLDFEKGMTSLTGETGAGKSILLGAIGIIIGDKPKKGAVRNGTEQAVISGTFDISYLPNVKSFLKEKGLLDSEDENQCIIRRIIRKDNRTSSYINDSASNLKTITILGEMLIEIHGQHQHQNLSKTRKQFDIIDSFGKLKDKRKHVSSLYKEWRNKIAASEKIKLDFEDNFNKFQLLNYKRVELIELEARAGETEELEKEQNDLDSAESIISSCEDSLDLLNEGFNSSGDVLSMISKSISNIESINDPERTSEIVDMLEIAKINIEEAIPSIKDYSSHFEVNPIRLEEVEARLRKLNKASEHFHCFPEQLFEILPKIEEEIKELNYSEDSVDSAKIEEEAAFESYKSAAMLLSAERIVKAKELSNSVNQETIKLNLAEDILQIYFNTSCETKDQNYDAYGLDSVDFLIRPNLGQEYQSVAAIASGGELSRLSLAVQVVSYKNEKKPTMIFDEVDTGLSGETGNVVGEMLRRVGEFGQVMCVTHLPQVAAQGHSHFFVSKKNVERNEDVVTLSNISILNNEERINEVARMIGGDINSQESINSAKAMLSLHN